MGSVEMVLILIIMTTIILVTIITVILITIILVTTMTIILLTIILVTMIIVNLITIILVIMKRVYRLIKKSVKASHYAVVFLCYLLVLLPIRMFQKNKRRNVSSIF